MSIKISSDGFITNTKIVDVKTGADLSGYITRVEITIDAKQSKAQAILYLDNVELDLVAVVREVKPPVEISGFFGE